MADSIASSRSSSSAVREDLPTAEPVDGTTSKTRMMSESDFTGAAILCVVATAISTALVLSYADDYIELADQSLYLLMTDDPRASIRSASGFHVLLAPLWSLTGESVIGFRILRAVLDIGVDLLLGVSLLRYLRSREYGDVFASVSAGLAVVFSVTLSGFAVWIYAVNGFGYDQVGGIVLTGLVAAVLWLVGGQAHASKDSMLAAVAGALFALALIVRWTAALASSLLFVWVLVEHCGWRRTRSLLGASAVGAVGSLALIHLAVLDVGVVFRGIRDGTSDMGRGAYSLPVLISRYTLWLRNGAFGGLGLIIAMGMSLLLFKKLKRTPVVLLLILGAASQVVIIVQVLYRQAQLIEANTWGTYLALVGGVAVVMLLWRNWDQEGLERIRGLAVPVTLMSLPVLLAAGSFLPLLVTALPLATLWLAGLWVALPSLANWGGQNVALLAVGVMLAVLPWLLYQNLANPARTRFAEEPVLVAEGRFEGLWVDETTQQFLHDLEALRLQVGPDPTVLSFWTRPVVPFALDGTALGFPWYSRENGPNAAAHTISGACLDDGDTPTGDVVVVTQEADPVNFGPIRGALLDCGIDFPDDFEFITTMVAPDASNPEDIQVSVYLREAER